MNGGVVHAAMLRFRLWLWRFGPVACGAVLVRMNR